MLFAPGSDDIYKDALALHASHHGKLEIQSKVPLVTIHDLSSAYTPEVAEVCRQIAKDKNLAYTYTMKANTIAIVTMDPRFLASGR